MTKAFKLFATTKLMVMKKRSHKDFYDARLRRPPLQGELARKRNKLQRT
jgi:hypothetical protein